MAEPNAAQAQAGPGLLYIAPLGTAEPTSLTSARDVGFLKIGYTEKGSTFTLAPTFVELYVAEAFDPVKVLQTQRKTDLSFDIVEISATNLQRALNGGTIVAGKYSPPPAGTNTRVMLLWESDDLQERWLVRQAVQTGNVAITRNKGVLSVFTVNFKVELPATNLDPFTAWFDPALRA